MVLPPEAKKMEGRGVWVLAPEAAWVEDMGVWVLALTSAAGAKRHSPPRGRKFAYRMCLFSQFSYKNVSFSKRIPIIAAALKRTFLYRYE